MDRNLSGSWVHGILQARNAGVGCHFLFQENLPDPGIKPSFPLSPALQADSLPAAPSVPACSVVSGMSDSVRPPWSVARQAPLSMGFSRQECWSGLLPILFKKKNPEGSFSENQDNDLLFKNSCKTKPPLQDARKFEGVSVRLQKSITHRPVSASSCAIGQISICL